MSQNQNRPGIDWAAMGFSDPDAVRRPDAAELVICVNRPVRADRPSCGRRGAIAIADALEAAIGERDLPVKVTRINCFGWCSRGPNLRIVGGRALHGVVPDSIPHILDALSGDPPDLPVGNLPGQDPPAGDRTPD